MNHNLYSPPLWTLFPFVALLLCIALAPLFFGHFWEKNKNKAWSALVCSLPILFYFGKNFHPLLDSLEEYFSFICLIGSLFIISGGISIEGDLKAKPTTNLLFLAIGAILANLLGTTGASMLLIRPFLKTNSERKHTWHQPLFFIFIVSNFGGLLTPLGDPPLFLGYLNGVPFTWTLSLFPVWIFAVGILLNVFYLWDKVAYQKEISADLLQDATQTSPLKIKGLFNLILLMGVIGAVSLHSPFREMMMMGLALLSFFKTSPKIHEYNQFSFSPIIEVAILFAGIFITMTPALQFLQSHAHELHLTHPWQFFAASGILSSFLDNAPTYLTFFNIAKGLHISGGVAGVPERLLQAISIGSVFMGANSYIGNGPNFMVKAIAEQQGFKTLNFGAYLLMAMVILGPLYILIGFVFF